MINDSQRRRMILVWAVPGRGQTVDELAPYLQLYLRAKKYQAQAEIAACMFFDRQTKKLVKLLYLNTPDDSTEDFEHLLDRLQPLARTSGRSRVAR